MAITGATSASTALSAVSGASSAGSTGTSSQEIAGNFQDFLLLLTTQLKNQSPLDPLDTNQFTQQLVQFAGVEQQLKSNDTLTSILTAMKATSTANAASYVGLEVTADGSSASLSNGAASWTVNAAKAATKATVTLKDSAGKTVLTRATVLQAGSQAFRWNGKDATGAVLPDGQYSLSVSATDASGQAVAVSTDITGIVSGVDVSGASPVLTIGSSTVPLASIKTIAR